MGVVISGFVCALLLLKTNIYDWTENPTSEREIFQKYPKCKINNLFIVGVGILTHSLDVTELDYPSITICKEKGLYDPGEYIRPIFNQFQFSCHIGDGSCNKTELLREHYQEYFSVDGGLNIDYFTGNQWWTSDSDDKSGIAYTTYLFGLGSSWLSHL